jgi:hypothetical protein
MESLFLLLYDKVTNLAAPGYLSSEIEEFLNKAQEQKLYQTYTPKGNKYQEGLEETEKRRKDLSELTRNVNLSVTDQSSSQVGTEPNGVFYDLPLDFLYTMSEEITITSTNSCIDGSRVQVKPITHDEYTINRRNPWKRPDETLVWRLEFSREVPGATEAKRHELITDGVSITPSQISNYQIRYIKRPRQIVINASPALAVDCELDESVHREIVDIAVRIATGITDPQQYQFKIAEQSKAE